MKDYNVCKEKKDGIILRDLLFYGIFNVVTFLLTMVHSGPALEYLLSKTGKQFADDYEYSKNKLDCD